MHKRARNHALKTMWRKDIQECVDIILWYPWYKNMEKYEPQGKREFWKLKSVDNSYANLYAFMTRNLESAKELKYWGVKYDRK